MLLLYDNEQLQPFISSFGSKISSTLSTGTHPKRRHSGSSLNTKVDAGSIGLQMSTPGESPRHRH